MSKLSEDRILLRSSRSHITSITVNGLKESSPDILLDFARNFIPNDRPKKVGEQRLDVTDSLLVRIGLDSVCQIDDLIQNGE